MKTLILALAALLFCAQAAAFPDLSRERLKANKAWEKQVRKEFDFSALRTFLIQTIAGQKQFNGVDLTASFIEQKWKANSTSRTLTCGSWSLTHNAKTSAFELRHFPGHGDRDVVLVCERTDKRSFRLLEIKWAPMELQLARGHVPASLHLAQISPPTLPGNSPA